VGWWRNTAARAAEATAGYPHLPALWDGADASAAWPVDPYVAVAAVAACHAAEVCLAGGADARTADAFYWAARAAPEALAADVAAAAAGRGVRFGAASTPLWGGGRAPAASAGGGGGGDREAALPTKAAVGDWPGVCGHAEGCASPACAVAAYAQVVRTFRAVPRAARGTYVVERLPVGGLGGAALAALAKFIRRMRAL